MTNKLTKWYKDRVIMLEKEIEKETARLKVAVDDGDIYYAKELVENTDYG